MKYSLKVAGTVGYRKFWRSLRSKNTCKTCAYGMGGQRGGMTNEAGTFFEVCKKSIQAQLTDIQDEIPKTVFVEKSLADLKAMSPLELERLGRLNYPLRKHKGDTHYLPISWDEAFISIASRFKEADPARTFFYSSGRSSNEAAFLLQIFARVYGTNNINNCSYYCHQASGVGLTNTIGSGTATIEVEDLKKADLIFVIGANPSSNHPRFLTELMHCRRRGGKVVVINPVKEPGLVRFSIPSDISSMLSGGSEIASMYVQPRIGGDLALLQGVGKALLEKGEPVAKDFIKQHTNAFKSYVGYLESLTWKEIVQRCQVSEERVRAIASVYAESKNAVFAWCMGITHHTNGVDAVEEIVNVALLRGMVGKSGAGLLPLRGHSNVQGIGSMGVTPALKDQVMKNLEDHLGVVVPNQKGMDTMACMNAAHEGSIDAALLLGGNLYGSNPNSAYAASALNKIPFKLFISTTLNQSHVFGVDEEVVVLPCAARDEEEQKTTQESMFNFVRMSDGGIVRLNNVKSEVEIISDIAKRVCTNATLDFSAFKRHSNIRSAIAAVIPGFEALEKLDDLGDEFQVSGRVLHEARFSTSDKRALFTVHDIRKQSPQIEQPGYSLMTVRSEGQFNTIIYEDKDLFRDQTERWVVLMNEKDMAETGIAADALVDIKSDTGVMKSVKARPFNIARGCLLSYFPEANVLASTEVDERSRTPGFKSIQVTLTICN
ncbi:MAG: FdhF/YdeP family oxidoreductase [Flavobacteriales bacterium]|nr:FdhF/YdeP family oxidoreductase [Flavobacteriales bacterium]